MFLPPEQRQRGPPPSDSPRPRRRLTRREETVLLWVMGFVVVTIFLAPIGGSTLLDAVKYLLGR